MSLTTSVPHLDRMHTIGSVNIVPSVTAAQHVVNLLSLQLLRIRKLIMSDECMGAGAYASVNRTHIRTGLACKFLHAIHRVGLDQKQIAARRAKQQHRKIGGRDQKIPKTQPTKPKSSIAISNTVFQPRSTSGLIYCGGLRPANSHSI